MANANLTSITRSVSRTGAENATNDIAESSFKILSEAEDVLLEIGALASACASLVIRSEHGERDHNLSHAITLLIMLEKQAMKLASDVNFAHITLEGGAA